MSTNVRHGLYVSWYKTIQQCTNSDSQVTVPIRNSLDVVSKLASTAWLHRAANYLAHPVAQLAFGQAQKVSAQHPSYFPSCLWKHTPKHNNITKRRDNSSYDLQCTSVANMKKESCDNVQTTQKAILWIWNNSPRPCSQGISFPQVHLCLPFYL